MAQFEICITEKGRELLAASVGGEPLTFAKMVLGDGGYGGDLSQVEGVISPKIQLEIGSVERYENQVSIQSVITPGTEVPPFFWREVGVYAQDPASGGEVLAVYGNAGDKGDYLSGAGGILDEKIINITILVEPDQVVTDFSGVLFVTQKEFAAHTGDSGIHVTAADKQKWDSRTVFPLAHAKSETTHALTGLSGVSGTVSCVFTATAAYAAGDTFTVDGTAYTIQLSNGEEAEDNLFVAGASVPVVVDTAGKKVNFKAAGGKKLPAGTMAIVQVFTENGTFVVPKTGKYKITAIGHGGSGGVSDYGYNSGVSKTIAAIAGSGAAGGAGELIKELNVGENYPVTIDTAQTSFGSLISATAGGDGSDANAISGVAGTGGKKGISSGYSTLLPSEDGKTGSLVTTADHGPGLSGGACNGVPGGEGGKDNYYGATPGFASVGVSEKGLPPFGTGAGSSGITNNMTFMQNETLWRVSGWIGAVIVEMVLE